MSKRSENKMKGFTLVELLAVIVILAIILVIAVPKIMDTIKDATKASFESSAKMVAAQVENQYTVAKTLGKTFGDKGNCMQEWAGLNESDYASCTYKITSSGEATVSIGGKGKFNGLSVCNATRSTATSIEGECQVETLATHIQGLYENETTRTSNGLTKDNTSHENIRYAGSNDVVKNYVEFGNTNEVWRIIGIFEVETSEGKTEELVKLVKEDSIGNMSWDSSSNNGGTENNRGYGINEWSQADLQNLLNGYYLGTTNTCTYCNNSNQGTCSNDCASTVTPINSTYKNMIESVVWNTGAIDLTDTTIANAETSVLNTINWYNAERGTVTGKSLCEETGGIYCNDTVERTTSWTGLVALPYASDWGYASSEETCKTNMWDGLDVGNDDFTNGTCKKNNWMHYGTTDSIDEATWMLSPIADPDDANDVSIVLGDGLVSGFGGNYPLRVRPTIYLKSDIQIDSGDGSSGNAYKLA